VVAVNWNEYWSLVPAVGVTCDPTDDKPYPARVSAFRRVVVPPSAKASAGNSRSRRSFFIAFPSVVAVDVAGPTAAAPPPQPPVPA
jgi:hypothetical protein